MPVRPGASSRAGLAKRRRSYCWPVARYPPVWSWLAVDSYISERAAASRGGCRTNPRRAHSIRSKGGLRNASSRPSRIIRRSRCRAAPPLGHPLLRARSAFPENPLCDSLREDRHCPGSRNPTSLPVRAGFRLAPARSSFARRVPLTDPLRHSQRAPVRVPVVIRLAGRSRAPRDDHLGRSNDRPTRDGITTGDRASRGPSQVHRSGGALMSARQRSTRRTASSRSGRRKWMNAWRSSARLAG